MVSLWLRPATSILSYKYYKYKYYNTYSVLLYYKSGTSIYPSTIYLLVCDLTVDDFSLLAAAAAAPNESSTDSPSLVADTTPKTPCPDTTICEECFSSNTTTCIFVFYKVNSEGQFLFTVSSSTTKVYR